MLSRLPDSASLQDVDMLISLVADDGAARLAIEMGGSDCSLHPLILCRLAALASQVRDAGETVTLSGAVRECDSLQRMKFVETIDEDEGDGQKKQIDPTGKYIPLTRIVDNDKLNSFATDFVPLLHAPPETSNAVKYVLYELIRNVLEHAGSHHGAIAAAELTSDRRVLIGVADSGIGITKSIRRSHQAPDDTAAIKLALTPGVSGVTGAYGGNETNGGAGLFFMKALATQSRQRMTVLSGSVMMTLHPQETAKPEISGSLDDDHVEWSTLDVPFQGTAVGVDLRLEDAVMFAALLKEIAMTYHLNVKERKKEHRRARFT